MSTPRQPQVSVGTRASGGLSREHAVLLTRLDDALSVFDESCWRELHNLLLEPATQPAESQTGQWFEADPARLLREKDILSRRLMLTAEGPGLFYQLEHSGQIGAAGLLTLPSGIKVRVDLIFPTDFPQSPPRIYCSGSALRRLSPALRPDGSLPIPFGADQHWTPESTCEQALNWASDWFEDLLRRGILAPKDGRVRDTGYSGDET